MGDNIYGYYKSIFNHCDVFGAEGIESGRGAVPFHSKGSGD